MSTEKPLPIKETINRYLLFVFSLLVLAFGVAVLKKADWGISPMSSVPNVVSMKLDFLSMGNCLILWNCLMILGQILLLRNNFKIIQFLQLPLSIIFGYFTDFAMWVVNPITVNNVFEKALSIIIGILILAFGISLAVIADVIMNSGEAFVKALADTTKKDFGKIKTYVDMGCVLIALILSLLLFDFKIVGIGIGTVIIALSTGMVVRIYIRLLKKHIIQMITRSR